MDEIFHIHSGTAPSLRQGGTLRPLIHATLACLIMYSPERAASSEMNGVTVALRMSVLKHFAKMKIPEGGLQHNQPVYFTHLRYSVGYSLTYAS
jgi:hypothetical protein